MTPVAELNSVSFAPGASALISNLSLGKRSLAQLCLLKNNEISNTTEIFTTYLV